MKTFPRLWLFALVFLVSVQGFAQAVEEGVPAGCDVAFMGVLDAQAQLQGQRDTELASRLILKPDSVLEYSCFSWGLVNVQAQAEEGLFSGPRTKDSIENTVLDPMRRYFQNNYNHAPMGGTYVGQFGVCDAMVKVWDFAKCHNVDDALFRTLDEWAQTDPREFPQACDDSDRDDFWVAGLAAARPAAASPPADGGAASVQSYLEWTNPGQNADCSQSPLAPTGVNVITNDDVGAYAETICVMPGCFFDANTGKCAAK